MEGDLSRIQKATVRMPEECRGATATEENVEVLHDKRHGLIALLDASHSRAEDDEVNKTITRMKSRGIRPKVSLGRSRDHLYEESAASGASARLALLQLSRPLRRNWVSKKRELDRKFDSA